MSSDRAPEQRQRLARWVGCLAEAMLLLLVVLSPWAFGAVEPLYTYLLLAGLAMLLLLWAIQLVLQGRFIWKKDPVALCLAALFVLGIVQLTPLPRPVLERLSPAAVGLYDALLPQTPEVLPDGAPRVVSSLAAGKCLSIYPYATQQHLVLLLAVFLAYCLVRNTSAAPASLRRLYIALTANGAALSFFAIVQFFTSSRDTVYWTFQTPGTVFGPFVCRTHFPAYVNLSIGAGLGLLLAGRGAHAGARGILTDSTKLWLGAALALMVAAVALSLARGGFLSLAGAALVFALLRPVRALHAKWLVPAALAGAAALALVAWLGLQRVDDRLQTIWKGEALRQSRLPLWQDAWPLVGEFPLLGTGYGTFRYVEPLHRRNIPAMYFSEHAHNEFLEALIEGGVVRLGIMLLGIGLVFYWGYRAAQRHGGTPAGGLALGGLFAFTTLVIHSMGDFGIHLPAIALAAAVLAAQLVDLGRADANADGGAESDAYVFRWRGVAPWLGAATLVVLAATLFVEGWRLARVEGLRALARTQPVGASQRLELFEEASALAPDSAGVHQEVGEAYEARLSEETARLERSRQTAEIAQVVLSGVAVGTSPLVQATLLGPQQAAVASAWSAATAETRADLARTHRTPALRHYLAARDLCPLVARTQLRIASNVSAFAQADPVLAYLERTKRLITNDPELWFLFGLQEISLGRKTRARESWRRSLELSDKHLDDILRIGGPFFSGPEWAERVLPPRPEVLLKAALFLYSGPDFLDERRPLLDKALALLEAPGELRNGRYYYLVAQCQQHLGRPAEAQAAYEKALGLEPRQSAWRLDFARFLHHSGQTDAARKEVYKLLAVAPGHGAALEFLEEMTRPPPRLPPELIPAPEPTAVPGS